MVQFVLSLQVVSFCSKSCICNWLYFSYFCGHFTPCTPTDDAGSSKWVCL